MSADDMIFHPSPAIYEYARGVARERAAKQWSDERYWNLWLDWETKEYNPDWFDPWFEYETHGPANNAETDPMYQMTINLYYCYCWFKMHGYNRYAITGMMSSAIQESHISGGLWEGDIQNGTGHSSHRPYNDIRTFDSTYADMPLPDALGHHFAHWYYGGTYPLYANGAEITFDAEYMDYRNYWWHRILSGWDAVKRYPLGLSRQMITGVGMRVMPIGSVVEVSPGDFQIDESANRTTRLQINTNSPGYTGNGTGYGFCQWTPWTKLPRVLAAGYNSYHLDAYNESNRHWQMNGTLQLMVWELERYINRNDPDGDMNGGEYLGQWINSRVASPSLDGAYFIWPYYPNNLDNTAYWHFYGHSCTWDEYASGAWIARTMAIIQSMEQYPNMQEEDIEWCKRQMALAIYRSAFLQATYADFDFQERTYYIMDCIKYWDEHPLTDVKTLPEEGQGWDIRDIPRPRDLPFFELDQYHLTVQKFIPLTASRRKKSNVRTILL